MKLESKVKALEKASTGKPCTVVYKAEQGPAGDVPLPLEKALQEGRAGHLRAIHFPLTFNEEQRERVHKRDIFAEIGETLEGIQRDTYDPSRSDSLLFCSKPIVFAKQIPLHGQYNGYLETEDGTVFHQSEWRDILSKYNAGFIIVLDYDDTKEPWYGQN